MSLFPSFAFSEKSSKWTRSACNLSNWLLPLSTMHTMPTFEIHSYCCSSELLVLLFYCIALFTHSEGNPLSQFPWAGVVFLGHGTPETKTRVICCLTGSLVEGHSHCFQVLCVCVVLNTRSVWSATESGLLVTAGVGLLGQIPRHGACPAVWRASHWGGSREAVLRVGLFVALSLRRCGELQLSCLFARTW